MYTLFCGSWSKQFSSWWELIGYIKQHDYDKRYAHNSNDRTYYRLPIFYGVDSQGIAIYRFEAQNETRDCIAYNDNTIINLSEIREGLKQYHNVEKTKTYWYRYQRRYFEFRREPVPGISHVKSRNWRIPRHSYRSSWTKVCDGKYPKAKMYLSFDFSWDDECPRRPEKNWKSQGKKRHQWEKK